MAGDEFALGRQHLEAGLKQQSEWVGEHDLYIMLADAAAQQRDEAALQQYVPLAEEIAIRYDHNLYQAIAHRAWGVAHRLRGEYTEAEARLHQALEIFDQLGTRWQMGRTWRELAELAQDRQDTTQAQDYLSRALVAFEELGATPDATRIRVALEALD